jgi:hypothetical protein
MATLAIIAPDGRTFDVPEENVPAALAAGWKMPGAPAPTSGEAAPVSAEPAPPAPAEAAPPPNMVPVKAPDGRTFNIPETNLQAAMDAGWEPEVSLGQKIRTGAEGLVRGATLGISDAVQAGGAGLGTALGHALADDFGPGAVPRAAGPGIDAPTLGPRGMFDRAASQEALQGIRTRETASPTIAATTGVAGAILPALLSGGTSAAAGAARLTPAGLTSLLGARVQAHLAQKAGIGALGRLGALAAGGAAEAGVQSATERVVDDLISGDHEISAERMLSGLGGVIMDAGLGALTGGVVGGAIEGGQKAYGAVRGSLARRAAGQAAGEAAPSLTWDLSLEPAAAAEAAGPMLAKDLPSLADNSNSSIVQAARGSVDGFEDIQQGAVRAIRDDYDDILRLRAEVDGGANIGAKRADAIKYTGTPEEIAAARPRVNQMLDDTQLAIRTTTELDGFKPALEHGGGLTAFKRVDSAVDEARRIINQKLDEGELGEAFMIADDLKRIVGRSQNTPNSIAKQKLRDLYDRIVKPAGEDEATWGQLAVNQKRVNPAWTESIRRDQDDLIQPFTRTSGEPPPGRWDDLQQSNSAAIGNLLNGLGQAETEATEKAFRQHLRAAVVDAQTRAQVWGSANDIARATKMTQAVERIENRMNAVAFAAKDKKAWAKIMKYAPGTAGGVLQGAAKLGQLTLTPIQRMADAALKQQQSIEKAARNAGSVLLGAGSPKALLATISVNRMQDAVAQAQALQDPASPESGRLRQAVNEIAQDDPAFAAAMDQKQRQQAAFLAEKAGPVRDEGDPFATGPAPRDKVAAQQLGRYVAAVDDPGEALLRVSQGMGSAEDLEVLQTLYPRIYDVFVKQVEAQLKSAKKPPTTAQRQHLHRATGIPLAREQQPDALVFLQRVGNAPADTEQPPPPASGKGMNIDPEKHFGSRSDQILEGGE